jgi:hypothetical protein
VSRVITIPTAHPEHLLVLDFHERIAWRYTEDGLRKRVKWPHGVTAPPPPERARAEQRRDANWCARCERYLPDSAFYWWRNRSNQDKWYRQGACKECHKRQVADRKARG